MPQTDLQPFIDAAKSKGAADEFLAALLTRAGWPAADVYRSLGDWWTRETGIAPPIRRTGSEDARDAFLYLLSFATLAVWSAALGSLVFRLIEYWIPDPVARDYFYNFRSTVTWQIASILVALPVYLAMMRFILRDTAAHPERAQSGVKKWLTYIALLFTAGAVISDLVWFLDYFLTGELTLRFVLKCATVLAICGPIFWYYLGSLRGRSNGRAFGVAAVAGATLAVVLGLTVAGTPGKQRRMQADERRVQDLRAIAQMVATRPSLPGSLEELRSQNLDIRLTDPESNQPYEYNVNAADRYELCAAFAAPSENSGNVYAGAFWKHTGGRACFSFEKGRPVRW